ncbi:MAG: adenylate/guanylate cyclase domain-containing protein [Gammaproteobacteria bacterium]|nr:adenylate/guanylate cyclase domain-containing protein [Gammaproteobacteria bacterium]MDH3447873.1 adenylate/guanylate cyclase domain-containing protein [Gammaproteobacteria bacterium]
MQLQRLVRPTLSAIILLILLVDTSGLNKYPFIKQLENWTYDARLNFTRPDTIDDRIVIIDIDETSLAEVGRWPWGRNKLATIVNNLFDLYEVDTVGFDIVFAEKDQSSGLEKFDQLARTTLRNNAEYLQALQEIRPSLMHDEIFADSLIGKNIVLGYYFKTNLQEDETGITGMLPPALTRMDLQWSERLPINRAVGYGGNLEILQASAKSGGYFDNPFVDADGVFRRVPLVQAYQGYLFASLALAVSQAHLGADGIQLAVETEGTRGGEEYYALETIDLRDYRIPVDANGAVFVPYRGRQGSFTYIPAHEVLNRKTNPQILKDKIVLIGTSAPGLLDLRSTPVQNIYPGVEVHANIISGILDDRIKHKPAWTVGYEFVLLVVIAVSMALLLPLVSPLLAAAGTLGLTGLVMVGTFLAWNNNLILPLASPLLLILLLFILHMSYGYFIESRGKRQLAHLFGHYIPPELVDEMSESPEEYSLEGENREMTVLFSDVRGFTSISEGMDPKQLTQLMNALLTPMTRVIHKNRGTIDKYMGDAIMSFWGAPLHDSEHARHALYAAMEMMDELKIMQEDFERRGWPKVDIGIGLNTGDMNVGNMGSEFRMAYTVLGDAVNLGSRLEGLTKNYGVNIIVSETTKAAVPEFVFRELDLVRVKGKNEPVAIFEPVGHKNDLDKSVTSELTAYKQALMNFRAQSWDRAELDFFNLNRTSPGRMLYQVYLERITVYRNEPPGDGWDGVFTHTTK